MSPRNQSSHFGVRMPPIFSMIVAMDQNRIIGRDNQMPWHLPADLQYFKRRTLGKPVVMGRKTILSIGRALPQRTNIVLTRQRDFVFAGCQVVHSFDEAIQEAGDVAEVVIIGGGTLYEQFLDRADRLYVTEIQHSFDGDTSFPEISATHWREVERVVCEPDERNAYSYHFVTYERC